MKDWVGVLHGASCLEIPKKEILLFDKVAVVHLEGALETHRHTVHGEPEIADQLEWLEEQSLLIRTEGPPQSFYWDSGRQSDLQLIGALYKYADDMRERMFGPRNELPDGSSYRSSPPTPENIRRFELSREADWARTSLVARTTADYLREARAINAVSAEPIPDLLDQLQTQSQNTSSPAPLSDVAEVVLNALPLPSEITPIEDIIAFKRETEQQLLALRIWMRDLAKAKLPPDELAEKLEWLLHEYQRHMNLQKLKTQIGTLEMVITTTLEVAEDLVKIKWSNVAQTLFSLRRRKLVLLEAEASAPGREISYVVSAKDRFKDGAG
jgi:hypothetical protein